MAKCDWCHRDVPESKLEGVEREYKEYRVCQECLDNEDTICEWCHKDVGDVHNLIKKTLSNGTTYNICSDCNTSKRCDWCHEEKELKEYRSGDFTYHICCDCFDSVENNKCRVCGEFIVPGFNINGVCINCVQTSKDRMIKEERAMGVDIRSIRKYYPEDNMSYEEFMDWITGNWKMADGRKYSDSYSEESKKKVRFRLLSTILKGKYGWTEDLIREHFEDLVFYICGYFEQIMNGEYLLIEPNVAGITSGLGEINILGTVSTSEERKILCVTKWSLRK